MTVTKDRQNNIFKQLLLVLVVAFIFRLLASDFSPMAHADTVIQVARIECMPELGVVSVVEESLRGKRALRSLKDRPEEIAAKYGYYDISSYFMIEGENDDPPNPRIVGRHAANIECQLADHEVEITFEPSIAKPCSAAVTIALSVRVNGAMVVDDLSLYKTCLRQDSISSFRFEEDGEFIMIEARADKTRNTDESGDSFGFTVVYQLNELGTQPIRTFEDLFSAYELDR